MGLELQTRVAMARDVALLIEGEDLYHQSRVTLLEAYRESP